MKKNQIIASLIWKLTERLGVQIVGIIINIILARLLIPADYGVISLTAIFINISNILIQSGMSASLLQKRKPDSKDYSTALITSFGTSIILYIIIFLIAPFIAQFFNIESLKQILRVISLKVVFDSVYSIEIAYSSKKLQYKKIFVSSLMASFISGIIGIILASNNFGVWSLVYQQLLFSLVNSFVISAQNGNIFSGGFSKESFKSLFSFGFDITISNLIDSVFLNLRSLLVGKYYSASSLGYFNQGRQIPEKISTNVNGSIQSVMLVAYSDNQEDKQKLKQMVRKSMSTSAYIIFPVMIGISAVAKPLVNVMLTEKWSSSIIFIQVAALTFMWMPIHTANIQVIKALGKSKTVLRLQILRKAVEIIILIISLKISVLALAIGEFFSTIISFGINLYPNKKYINYGLIEQLQDIFPSFLSATIMGIIIYQIQFMGFEDGLTLIIQVVCGIIIYVLLSLLFKIQVLQYILKSAKDIFYKDR